MRKIEPKMIEWLDKKLEGNGSYHEAVLNKDARAVFAFAMEACVGIREVGGNNRGPLVELIQETVGGHSGEAWCMSLQQTGIAYAEVKTGIQSRLPAGEHCVTIWNTADHAMRVVSSPMRGAIAIWKHGNTTNGHTGMFVEDIHNGNFKAVEGNTEKGLKPDGTITREGGGCYKTERSFKGNGNMKLLGFLKPF